MSFDVEQHVLYNIANAPMQRHPFPHVFVRDVFPADYYRELLDQLPGDDVYVPIGETGTVPKDAYPERHICSLEELEEREAQGAEGSFWTDLSDWLMGDRFADALMRKFKFAVVERFGDDVKLRISTECRFVRDHTNYAIAPHTDKPQKLLSLLFYLPRDASKSHLGTSIYAPEDPNFRCDGTAHHSFHGFKHVARMDYVPNALFAFFKTDQAFHGVAPIPDPDIKRDVMLYNIYVKKALKPQARAAFRWPWLGR